MQTHKLPKILTGRRRAERNCKILNTSISAKFYRAKDLEKAVLVPCGGVWESTILINMDDGPILEMLFSEISIA
jgi:hypothetical protein